MQQQERRQREHLLPPQPRRVSSEIFENFLQALRGSEGTKGGCFCPSPPPTFSPRRRGNIPTHSSVQGEGPRDVTWRPDAETSATVHMNLKSNPFYSWSQKSQSHHVGAVKLILRIQWGENFPHWAEESTRWRKLSGDGHTGSRCRWNRTTECEGTSCRRLCFKLKSLKGKTRISSWSSFLSWGSWTDVTSELSYKSSS